MMEASNMGIYTPNFLPFLIVLRHFKDMFPDKQAVIAGEQYGIYG